ncbi:hypothetical protein [Calderihabitans maritimus]|uniref:General stress protein 17M-like domain-containing protein n=1 Tax=Calderihabitans maritimus TaxID=1246530 RepID=A0A1Z5HW52_9FIRM|nr:hypothetical protein [Calderihabitans maritimus]GAW93766.1 hypothetical protein Moth_0924 [Calderihabitans maritimus]
MEERSILATFPSSTKAYQAVESLKKAGYTTVQINRITKYPSDPNAHYNNPIASQATSVAALTQHSGAYLAGDVAPLLAADNAASGFSTGDKFVGNHSMLVTVVTSPDRVQQAVAIIKEHGGEV